MFEEEYRKLFDNFSLDLHELANKKAEAGNNGDIVTMPYEYVFFVRDAKTKKPTNWACGGLNYASGELIENIIHELALDDFHHLKMTNYDKETYKDQVRDIFHEILFAGDERLSNMKEFDNPMEDDIIYY